MQADSQALFDAVRVISYGRSMADGMYGRLTQAVSQAESSNMGRKFKKCTSDIRRSLQLVRKSIDDLCKVGQKLEKIAYIVREME